MKIRCIGGPLDGVEIDMGDSRNDRLEFRDASIEVNGVELGYCRDAIVRLASLVYVFHFTNRYEDDGETPIYEFVQ
jgi:hypothetical protein